jgi:antitoxin component YwqK of YwqJK toxin-antitoxin module
MKILFSLVLSSILSISAYCQTDSAKKTFSYPHMDTINYYDISSESMSFESGQVIYKVNDHTVTQDQWRKMTIGKEKLKTCTPCMVRTYDAHDELVSAAVQYTKCNVGAYTGYYADGKVKVTGRYKENHSGKWDKPALSMYCTKKEGVWTYYNESGKVSQLEQYQDGKLIRKTAVK